MVYFVISGQITVVSGGRTAVLRKSDSRIIPAHEARTVVNDSHEPATVLVLISKVEEPA